MTVSATVRSADFPTITEALKEVAPGGTIRVRPGRYSEGLVLEKSVTILGDGDPKGIIVVIRAGVFRDRQHAIHEAIETLFVARPQLRTEAAVELFRSGEVSFLCAAELASLDSEAFRRLLCDRGIAWEIEAETSSEMDQAITDFFGESA